MKRNDRLSLALHALGHMAARPDVLLTSTEIAAHNRTNAVYVRRVLGLLREGGLVASEKGHGGGWCLARPASEIMLADVYRTLGERFLRPEPQGEDNPSSCEVEAKLRGKIDAALDAAEATLIERLGADSIVDISMPAKAP